MEQLTRRNSIALLLVTLATLVAVYFGWRLFWFLTDDAFIAFRYISNSQLGYGYVWNAPPFRAVEGYTSFLWVVLLDVIWRISGVAPPDAANYISLIFTYLTLLIGGLMVLKMKLRAELGRHRILFLALIFAYVVSNRTFLAWSSSGLETAMFNCFLTLWIYCCLFLPAKSRPWIFSTALVAALLTLTRPDGLLFAVVTGGLIASVVLAQARRSRAVALRSLVSASPLLIILVHFLWRRIVYKAWLPNTYYAKTIAGRIWPESGIRYALSFVIEYSLWLWLIVFVVVIALRVKRMRSVKELSYASLIKAAVCLSLLLHVLYYTIVIGGDHFEYRVYSQLILLLSISFFWMLNRLQLNLKPALLLFSLFMVLSWPIPWIHWSATRNLIGRNRTVVLITPVAKATQRILPRTPNFLLAYLRTFDALQAWLIEHHVCMRHQEHKNYYLYLKETLPSREEGMKLPDAGYPVSTASSVGVVSWVLPKVNIIDVLGLNDYVVARNPDIALPIEMAHERRPPPGYVECFSPNVAVDEGHFVISERAVPLTAMKITVCEQEYAALVTNPIRATQPPPDIRNKIDERFFFVGQLYRDMLDREADPNGLGYWAEHLMSCPTGTQCFNDSRAKIVTVLFDAEEFQESALFIYRLHAAAFGSAPRFDDFVRDRQLLKALHVDDWRDPADVIPAQRSFIESWVRREPFRVAYPDAMNPEEFVDRLYDHAHLTPFISERKRQVEAMRAGKSRAEVLREVVETDEFKRRENKRALVIMQFLLQLRRDVDYGDPTYKVWLDKLDRNEPVDPAHVICLILTSEEYQRRFGSLIPHGNAECH